MPPIHTLIGLLVLAAGFLGGAAVLGHWVALPPLDTPSRVQLGVGIILAGMLLALLLGFTGLLWREAAALKHRGAGPPR